MLKQPSCIQKRAVLFPGITLAFPHTNTPLSLHLMHKKPFTGTQVNAVVLSSTFPCLGPQKEHWSTVVWLAWLQHRVSFSDTQLLPLIHPKQPATLGCTLMTIILMFVMHTHMQTQAKEKRKKKKNSTCAPTNANESRSVYAPKHT